MKIRRRLCANQNIALSLPMCYTTLFKDLIVRYCHTSNINEKLSASSKNNGAV
jgi:hypothetical protein